MDDIERYLDQVCSALGGSKALRLHLREELREHILEAVEKYRADGLEQKPAVQKALEDFGQPQTLRQELQGVYGRPFVALLIEKAMCWKEKTMKTGWKWNFVALLAVALLIALQVAFVMSIAVWILPHVFDEYQIAGETLPDYSLSVVHFMRIFFHTWFIWLIPLAVIWIIFEWKCRSENKSKIRLACGASIALAMTVLVWASTIAVAVPLVTLRGKTRSQHPESKILSKITEADIQFSRLAQAIKKQEWQVAQQSARKLRRTFKSLGYSGSTAPTLVAIDKREDFDDIRQMLEDIAELSDDISDSIRDLKELEERELIVPRYFSRLEESYKQLKAKVPGWPATDQP